MFVKRFRSSPFFSENGTNKLWKSSCVTAALGPRGVRGELRRLRRLRPAGRTPRGDEIEVFSEVTIKPQTRKNNNKNHIHKQPKMTWKVLRG